MVDLSIRTKASGSLQGTRSYKLATSDEIDKNTKVAAIFVGNKGAGKSALLSHLGGNFESGFSFIAAVTRNVKKQQVRINGQPITLFDTPGLYDIENDETESNSRKLTVALREDFHFKLFFVLSGHSRIISPEDLALMSRVSQAIRDTNGAKVEFRVIVNQIRGDKEYQEYKTKLTPEILQRFFDTFSSNTSSEFSFDILVRDILLIRHDEEAINNKGFRSQLIPCILSHKEVGLKVDPIQAQAKDVRRFQALMKENGISIFFVASALALFPFTVAGSIVAISCGVVEFISRKVSKK